MKTVREIAAGEGFAGLPEGVEPCAARDQDRLTGWSGVVDSFDEPLPALHLVDFIQDEQLRVEGPRLMADDAGIIEIIVIQVLGIPEFLHQLLGQPGLADLPRPGYYDHLLCEIPFDGIIEIAIHSDFISIFCIKVKTIMQSYAILEESVS
jgi:hypothetical protein